MKCLDFVKTQVPCRTAEPAAQFTPPPRHGTLASSCSGASLAVLDGSLGFFPPNLFHIFFFTPLCPCSFLSCAWLVLSCLQGFIPHGQMNCFVSARWWWHLSPHPRPPTAASAQPVTALLPDTSFVFTLPAPSGFSSSNKFSAV